MANYLVTGGAGFIGSHIVDALVKRGGRVRVFDNLSTGKLENLSPSPSPLPLKGGEDKGEGVNLGKIEFIQGDIRDKKTVRLAVQGIDYVFQVAALRAVLRSVDDPEETHDVNVTGTLNLLLAAKEAGVKRIVFSSSSSVYGDTDKFPCEETDRPRPQSPYASSKIMGEYYCQNFTKLYGLETVCLRYFNVFGPRQNPESVYSAVIPIFVDCLLKGVSPEIHWDGKQSRDFSYVDNVVEGNLLAAHTDGIAGEIFNIACHEEFSVLDIFENLKDILRRGVLQYAPTNISDIQPVFKPKRAGDVRRTYADISKAEKLLGFEVQTRFKEGLKKTVDWFLKSEVLEKA